MGQSKCYIISNICIYSPSHALPVLLPVPFKDAPVLSRILWKNKQNPLNPLALSAILFLTPAPLQQRHPRCSVLPRQGNCIWSHPSYVFKVLWINSSVLIDYHLFLLTFAEVHCTWNSNSPAPPHTAAHCRKWHTLNQHHHHHHHYHTPATLLTTNCITLLSKITRIFQQTGQATSSVNAEYPLDHVPVLPPYTPNMIMILFFSISLQYLCSIDHHIGSTFSTCVPEYPQSQKLFPVFMSTNTQMAVQCKMVIKHFAVYCHTMRQRRWKQMGWIITIIIIAAYYKGVGKTNRSTINRRSHF